MVVVTMAQDGLCWDRVSGLFRVFGFVLSVSGVMPGAGGAVSGCGSGFGGTVFNLRV